MTTHFATEPLSVVTLKIPSSSKNRIWILINVVIRGLLLCRCIVKTRDCGLARYSVTVAFSLTHVYGDSKCVCLKHVRLNLGGRSRDIEAKSLKLQA